MCKDNFDRYDLLDDFVVRRSEWAWAFLSLGNLEEANRLGALKNDITVWAASLALSGKCEYALLAIEVYIVSTCQIVSELIEESNQNKLISLTEGSMLQRHNLVMAKWLTTRKKCGIFDQKKTKDLPLESYSDLSSNSSFNDGKFYQSNLDDTFSKYQRVIEVVMQLVSWQDLHLWYIIALTLLNDVDASEPYSVPVNNVWFRNFFAFPFIKPDKTNYESEHTFGVTDTGQIMQEKALEFLLSQCSEWEVFLVSAFTAFYTQRYRTSIEFASRFLKMIPLNPKDQPQSCDFAVQFPEKEFYRISMVAIRCQALLELGSRPEASEDIVSLMQVDIKAKGTPSEYVSVFGCALALYGMPLHDSVEPLNRFLSLASDKASIPLLPAQVHVLSTAYYVHALTLLQLGQMDQTIVIANAGLHIASSQHLKEAFKEIILRAAVAREDSTTILEMSIKAPHQLVYLSLCPAFSGGLSPMGVYAKRGTPVFRQLYPTKLPFYASTRQLLPFYMNKAYSLFHHHCYAETWSAVCCAVDLADEIVGSTEFAFTPCFPLHVYYYACKVGFDTLEYVLENDIKKSLVSGDHSLTSNFPSFNGLHQIQSRRDRSKAVTYSFDGSTGDNFTNLFDSEACVQIIDLCRHCVQQIYAHYPHSVLGDVTVARVAVMSHEPNYISKAMMVSRRYPKIILAQTTWALALFFHNNISNAMDVSHKNFQDFPHSNEVVCTQKWMGLKGITYTFYYRTILPVEYGPGSSNRRFTKRFIATIVLVTINWIIYMIMFIVNLTPYQSFIASETLEVMLKVPPTWTFFIPPIFLIYGLIMAFTSRNLVQALLDELHFRGDRLNRFIFVMRSVVMFNLVNVIQITSSDKWVFPNDTLLTMLFLTFVITLTMPFTTRVWFLPSVDEPMMGILQWVSVLITDVATYVFVCIPHAIFVVFEPFMAIAFFFVVPLGHLGLGSDTASIRRRLLYHEKKRYTLPPPGEVGSGSSFIYIKLMKLLYYETHVAMTSKHLDKLQIESEGYRAFPLINEALALDVPVDHTWIDLHVVQFFLARRPRSRGAGTIDNPLAWTREGGQKESWRAAKWAKSPLSQGSTFQPFPSIPRQASRSSLYSESEPDPLNAVGIPIVQMIDKVFKIQTAAFMGSFVDRQALQSFYNWNHRKEMRIFSPNYEPNSPDFPTLRSVESFVTLKEYASQHSDTEEVPYPQQGLFGVWATIKRSFISRVLYPVKKRLFKKGVSNTKNSSGPGSECTNNKTYEKNGRPVPPSQAKIFKRKPSEITKKVKPPFQKLSKSNAPIFVLNHCEMVGSDSDRESEYSGLHLRRRAVKPSSTENSIPSLSCNPTHLSSKPARGPT
ncbi:unnamed protein product [Phytomonas sp. Hart1]|nr:unnamed protein product [Phytomonas sp. Hart1]|eukprot:CCW70203.1 unnamed protein product [Phytomonas sp. isolate Hart1]